MRGLAVLLSCLCVALAWRCAGPESKGREPAGQAAAPGAPFAVSDHFRLDEYRGKVVLLNFWATWCPPCKAEIPDLVRLRNEFAPDRFALVGVSVDQASVADLQKLMRRFVDQYRINYPVYLDPEYTLARAFGGFSGIPTSFLIDQNGRTVRTYVGAQPFEVFARDLRALLRQS